MLVNIIIRSSKFILRSNFSSIPLIEKYRSTWPDYKNNSVSNAISMNENGITIDSENNPNLLLKRTIPEHKLTFAFSSSFYSGSAFFYPHLESKPSDYHVSLLVSIDDLELNKDELKILTRMVGKRLNVGKRELKLTSNNFPNKYENKKYLTLQLEKLLFEAKRLYKLKDTI